MEPLRKIEELLKDTMIIGYMPTKNEVNYLALFPFRIQTGKYVTVPTEKESDPFLWALKYQERYSGTPVTILIPGSAFDAFGTRHGRGGGWYDRFLSKVPKEWTRIGIVNESNFSKIKLVKQPWDESMDWIIVKSEQGWEIHQTHARKA